MDELVLARPGGHVAVRDSGDGPALLFLHGGGGNLASWDAVTSSLVDAFRIVAMDLTGHGRSWHPERVRWEDALADVALVHEQLGLGRPVVVGHSLGGATALQHAARHGGCAGVVAVDGAVWRRREEFSPNVYDPEDLRARGFGWRGDEDELEAEVGKLREREAGSPALDAIEAEFRRNHVRDADGLLQRIPTVEQIVSYARPPDPENMPWYPTVYEAVDCPVLLLNATEGLPGVSQRERFGGLPPHVTVEWLEGGHMLPWERPHDIAARIAAFAA